MAPVARGLEDSFRVLEPFQRGSGREPLTVDRHVRDLHELVASQCDGERPALVGFSWGAMLALAYAAAHPKAAGRLVLIGCGTFDRAARARLQTTVDERLDEVEGLRLRLERLPQEVSDPDERLRVTGELILPLYSHALVTTATEVAACDARAHRETWEDMVRQQDAGVYPAAFAAIESPVLMLHGAVDPHPGTMTRTTLQHYIPQLEYHEWQRCGHCPWLEKAVHNEFFSRLRAWLRGRAPG
jgi:pimeloyl-ACP methyl ester carboxylesterase